MLRCFSIPWWKRHGRWRGEPLGLLRHPDLVCLPWSLCCVHVDIADRILALGPALAGKCELELPNNIWWIDRVPRRENVVMPTS